MNLKALGFIKDKMSLTADWTPVNQILIQGVQVKEIKNVIKTNGSLTEIWRKEWQLDETSIDQIFQVCINPGEISDWHIHEFTTDRIFVNRGSVKIVLYDPNEDSPTYRRINEFNVGISRPHLITIPPGVCHAIQNITNEISSVINIVDRAYNYEDPDHWRLAANTDLIPYNFKSIRNSNI